MVVTRAVESESRSRSRKDFQPKEPESQKILTTPTPGRPFAHQLWLFVPQTCVSVTLGNLSSLTLQQEMIMAIQTGGSPLTCIPSLRGHSRPSASLGLITQPTLLTCFYVFSASRAWLKCVYRSPGVSEVERNATYTLWMQPFGACITEISICSFWLALSLLRDVGYATMNESSHGSSSIVT